MTQEPAPEQSDPPGELVEPDTCFDFIPPEMDNNAIQDLFHNLGVSPLKSPDDQLEILTRFEHYKKQHSRISYIQ